MKLILGALVLLLLLLQYELWFSPGGFSSVWKLKSSIEVQQQVNAKLKKQNAVLMADIKDLKKGDQAVEERARNDLGMVKEGEVFYQIVKPNEKQ